MEITRDNIETIHYSYDEYELSQLIALMSIGEKLTISIDDVVIKEYTAKYVNCHFNLGFQDKGLKVQRNEIEQKQKQIDILEAEKLELTIKETK